MKDIAKTYFDAFNAKDIDGMLACLSDDVEHHPNGGEIRTGKDNFRQFCKYMALCYDETLVDMVLFESGGGANVTAQYIVKGTYLQTDGMLPLAQGQKYTLPCKSHFLIENGLISKVATFYDIDQWLKQVS